MLGFHQRVAPWVGDLSILGSDMKKTDEVKQGLSLALMAAEEKRHSETLPRRLKDSLSFNSWAEPKTAPLPEFG